MHQTNACRRVTLVVQKSEEMAELVTFMAAQHDALADDVNKAAATAHATVSAIHAHLVELSTFFASHGYAPPTPARTVMDKMAAQVATGFREDRAITARLSVTPAGVWESIAKVREWEAASWSPRYGDGPGTQLLTTSALPPSRSMSAYGMFCMPRYPAQFE
jgi:hypothetical protein